MIPPDLDAILALSLTPGLGPTLTRRCLEAFGSPEAVLSAGTRELSCIEGIGPNNARKIRQGMDEIAAGQALNREKELVEQCGASLLTIADLAYPALLKHIPDPPPLLYVRGSLAESDALSLGIVGARQCTAYGREQADRLAGLCAQAGLTIVSGGAYGIDAAAHRGALRVNGRTIVVLGSGLASPYPPEHAPMFDQICAAADDGAAPGRTSGAVVSELPMSTPPMPENFPRRNRIISGLSLGVLVVEASLRSGALITARLASEEHNREVMALPGRVDSAASAGCHKILREGWAKLVTSAADILDALGDAGATLKGAMTVNPDGQPRSQTPSLFEQNLTDSQRKLAECLSQPMSLDDLAVASGLAVHVIQSDLTMLQIRGLIDRQGGMIRRKR